MTIVMLSPSIMRFRETVTPVGAGSRSSRITVSLSRMICSGALLLSLGLGAGSGADMGLMLPRAAQAQEAGAGAGAVSTDSFTTLGQALDILGRHPNEHLLLDIDGAYWAFDLEQNVYAAFAFNEELISVGHLQISKDGTIAAPALGEYSLTAQSDLEGRATGLILTHPLFDLMALFSEGPMKGLGYLEDGATFDGRQVVRFADGHLGAWHIREDADAILIFDAQGALLHELAVTSFLEAQHAS